MRENFKQSCISRPLPKIACALACRYAADEKETLISRVQRSCSSDCPRFARHSNLFFYEINIHYYNVQTSTKERNKSTPTNLVYIFPTLSVQTLWLVETPNSQMSRTALESRWGAQFINKAANDTYFAWFSKSLVSVHIDTQTNETSCPVFTH